MKGLRVLGILFFYSLFSFGQQTLSDVDYTPNLSNEEAEHFNQKFQATRQGFDFNDRKAAFVFLENIFLTNKKDYFKLISDKQTKLHFDFVVLTDFEKEQTNGFEVVILITDKPTELSQKKREKLLNAINKRESSLPDNLFDLGLDENPVLTNIEAEYFNQQFKDRNGEFDFTNKQIGYFYGNNGRSIQTKKEYFDQVKERLSHNYSASNDILVIWTSEQMSETGGYDAIIVSWSKLLVKDATNRMINELKKTGHNKTYKQ